MTTWIVYMSFTCRWNDMMCLWQSIDTDRVVTLTLAARNTCLRSITGDLIQWLDSILFDTVNMIAYVSIDTLIEGLNNSTPVPMSLPIGFRPYLREPIDQDVLANSPPPQESHCLTIGSDRLHSSPLMANLMEWCAHVAVASRYMAII